jgi:hypothetical protein
VSKKKVSNLLLAGDLGGCDPGGLDGLLVSLARTLGGETGVTKELGVDALEGHVPLGLGLLDAVAVVLARLVVRRVVLGLGPARRRQRKGRSRS